MIDRKKFFKSVKDDFGKLKQSQVDGFNAVLDKWEIENLENEHRLAYICATAWHETAKTMQPIVERGKRSYFNKYESNTKIGKRLGNTQPGDGYRYRGRGYPMLTGRANYTKMGKIIGVDLVNNPDKMLETETAIEVMFEGMLTRKSFKGDFTGLALENFFNTRQIDPIGARKVVNGKDQAVRIADYYQKFYNALTKDA